MSHVWDSITDWFHRQPAPPSFSGSSDMEEDHEGPGRYTGESRDSGMESAVKNTGPSNDNDNDSGTGPVGSTDNQRDNTVDPEGEASDFDDDVIQEGNLELSRGMAVGDDSMFNPKPPTATTLFPITTPGRLDSTHDEEEMQLGHGARPRTKPIPAPPRSSPRDSQDDEDPTLRDYREGKTIGPRAE